MRILMVHFTIKDGMADAFLEAAKEDGRGAVGTEPGCHRFDIIRDKENPNRIAFTEVYENDAAIDDVHMNAPHFEKWRDATRDMIEGEPKVSRCRNVFPGDLVPWQSARPGVDESFFSGNLYVIHAPRIVQRARVEDWIEATKLDALGSTQFEPGCLRFDIYQNVENPQEFWLYEVYANEPAFQYHTTTPHITKWRETVADWYEGDPPPAVRGFSVWPPDNWNWSTGRPLA